MAKYEVKRLNYISSGNLRAFVNMDIELVDDSKIPIAVLRQEVDRDEKDPYENNIVMEQKVGHIFSNQFIATDFYDTECLETDDIVSYFRSNGIDDVNITLKQENLRTVLEAISTQSKFKRSTEALKHALGLEEDNEVINHIKMPYSISCVDDVLLSDFLSVDYDNNNVYLFGEKRTDYDRKDLVLAEQQNGYDVTEDIRSYIRIQLTSDTEEYKEKYRRFKENNIIKDNQTYVFDNYMCGCDDYVNSISKIEGTNVHEFYDINDVCLKSTNNVAKSNLLTMDSKKTEDIYVPQHSEHPIQFVQMGDNSYILLQNINKNENTMKIEFQKSQLGDVNTSYYNAKIVTDDKTDTYLYRNPNEIAVNQNFEPRVDMIGIGYNSLVEVEQNKTNNGTYTYGNEYGNIYRLKNSFDANYSMSMSSDMEIRNCRQYCGLGRDKSNIFLKYYDNVDYKPMSTTNNDNRRIDATMEAKQHEKFPYQKIEYFIPNSMTNTTKHKSNFFSVRFLNSNLGSIDETDVKNFGLIQLKKDIQNAVREICDNVAPANTQLFDIQFTEGAS